MIALAIAIPYVLLTYLVYRIGVEDGRKIELEARRTELEAECNRLRTERQ